MKKYFNYLPFVALILGTVMAFSFKTTSRTTSPYWVYSSASSSSFKDASKYEIRNMETPDDADCSDDYVRPCVFSAATGSLSSSTGLQAYLTLLSSDSNILSASIRTKD